MLLTEATKLALGRRALLEVVEVHLEAALLEEALRLAGLGARGHAKDLYVRH